MRLHRWLLILVSRLVPKDVRADWRAEWEGELQHRETALEPWRRPGRRGLDLFRHSSGAFWDALWLQSSRWYSLRLFGRHWRLALTAVLSLGVAIAATTTGLSAYNALLLRPPGVGDHRSLRMIHGQTSSDPYDAISFPEYEEFRAQTRAFSDIAAYPFSISTIALKTSDGTEQVVATEVSNNFFSVLAVAPRAGVLAFRPAPSEANQMVIGTRLWKRLGGGLDVVGRIVELNDQSVTITGIVPETFKGMTWGFDPDVWMSFKTNEKVFGSSPAELTDRTRRQLHLIGRLKPGVTAAQASTDVGLIAATIERDHPDTAKGRSAVITPLTITPPGDRAWASMILGSLVFIVILTLVVACANVTNLLLGLSTARRHEMLVRAALGASRMQLILPLLRESAVLGLASGLVGYGAAWVALAKLAAWKPAIHAFLPALSLDLRPDFLVLAGTMAIALVAGIAVGLPPALRGAADGLSGSINRELSASEPRTSRIRAGLVVVQMAVATVVLVGVGLAVQSLIKLHDVPLGFSAKHLVYGGVDLQRTGYDGTTGPAFYARIREQLGVLPNIEAVTISSDAPMVGYSTEHVIAEGDAPPPDGHGLETPYSVVDDQYFSALGIPLLQGRTFDSRDVAGRTDVAIINATLARRHWPDANPLGRRLRTENNRMVEVIGVVADGKYGDVEEDQLPFMFLSLAQHYQPIVTVIARTNGPRDTVMLALADIDSRIVFGGVGMMTLDDMLAISLLLPRIIVWTTIGFGVLALGLAVFGLYSTVFYAVSQRRIEMGIRTTLGARPAHLFALALRGSGWVALAGAALGLAAGLGLPPLAASIFYGIGSIEPVVIAGAAITSVAIVLLTTYLVVRPWTRTAPSDLLRR